MSWALRDTLTLVLFLAVLFTVGSCADKDDTDPASGRSGMTLHTDSLTGCQYLSRSFGGITPRLDGNGRHVGCKEGGAK